MCVNRSRLLLPKRPHKLSSITFCCSGVLASSDHHTVSNIQLQSTVLQNITHHTSQIMMRKNGRRGEIRVKQESQRIALLQGISSSSLCSSSSSCCVYPLSIIHEPQGTPDTKRMRRGGLFFSSSSLSFSSSSEGDTPRRKRFDMSSFALLPSRKKAAQQRNVSTNKTPLLEKSKKEPKKQETPTCVRIPDFIYIPNIAPMVK